MVAIRKLRGLALPIVLGLLCAPPASLAAKRATASPGPPADPLVPASAPERQPTNAPSALPAPAARTLPAPGDPEFEFGGPLRKGGPETMPAPPAADSTNAPVAQVAAPAPVPDTQGQAPDAAADWITPDESPDAPLALRVIPPPDSVMVPGIFVRHMKVEFKNRSTDQAIAVRGVHWIHGLRRADWVKSLPGKSRSTPAGLVIVEHGPGATDTWFEHGLLLPGESLKIALPLTPQPSGVHVLEVDFAAVGTPQKSWRDEILIPVSRGQATEIFDAPADRSIQGRAGQGGTGLLRCALQGDTPGPDVVRVSYRVGLPLARGEWLHQLTGGLAMDDALSRAGLRPDDGHLAYFLDALRTWIFIRPADGDARALMQDGDPWAVLKGCPMDAPAPELMCVSPDGSTPALLDPSAFADIVKVQTPWVGKLYNPGKTFLKPDALRAVLRRAAERSIAIRVATIDPNGLGLEPILTFGVRVDAAGRWLSPSLGASPRPSPAPDSKTAAPAPTPPPFAGPPARPRSP